MRRFKVSFPDDLIPTEIRNLGRDHEVIFQNVADILVDELGLKDEEQLVTPESSVI